MSLNERTNKKILRRLKTRKEYHGYNGERHVSVPIVYDPKTGFEFDVAEMHEMEVGNVYDTKRTEVPNK